MATKKDQVDEDILEPDLPVLTKNPRIEALSETLWRYKIRQNRLVELTKDVHRHGYGWRAQPSGLNSALRPRTEPDKKRPTLTVDVFFACEVALRQHYPEAYKYYCAKVEEAFAQIA